MSAFIRNFEIIPSIGSYIVDVDLGFATVPLSGIVDFVSMPKLTSFKIKNGAMEYFENIRGCSALNVFNIADGVFSINVVVSCLSSFADRKAIFPELTGNLNLSGNLMPFILRYPDAEYQPLEYEFARLYSFLTSKPNPWNIIANKQPLYIVPNSNNQTFNTTTTGTDSAYVFVSSSVSAFNLRVNNYDGIYVNSYYNVSALSASFLTLSGTPQLTALTEAIYPGQSTTLSAIDGSLHTFYFFKNDVSVLSTFKTTLLSSITSTSPLTGSPLTGISLTATTVTLTSFIGSQIFGVGSESLLLKPILEVPVSITALPIKYPVPPRYGYINGTDKKSFNVNTSGGQITYVILNTATDLFSLKINDVSVLSARNIFNYANTSASPITASIVSLSGKQNLLPTTAKTLKWLSSTNLTGTGSVIYNLKYFYTPGRITLGIAQTGVTIEAPTNYYDRFIIQDPIAQEIFALPTSLPPEAVTVGPITATGSVPVITSSTRSTTLSGSLYSYQILATNTPTQYGATNLPTGLTINTATGVIQGTPTQTGEYIITLNATNIWGTGTRTLTLNVNVRPPTLPPVITSSVSAVSRLGGLFSYQIAATNSPTIYSATGLPAGINVNTTTGLVAGVPTVSGTYTSNVGATNVIGTTTQTLTINVSGPVTHEIISNNTITGQISSNFLYQTQITNADLPDLPVYFIANNLPLGLSMNTMTGTISGIPTVDGIYTTQLIVNNLAWTSEPFNLEITILP